MHKAREQSLHRGPLSDMCRRWARAGLGERWRVLIGQRRRPLPARSSSASSEVGRLAGPGAAQGRPTRRGRVGEFQAWLSSSSRSHAHLTLPSWRAGGRTDHRALLKGRAPKPMT